jgi:hypothetical protein
MIQIKRQKNSSKVQPQPANHLNSFLIVALSSRGRSPIRLNRNPGELKSKKRTSLAYVNNGDRRLLPLAGQLALSLESRQPLARRGRAHRKFVTRTDFAAEDAGLIDVVDG